MSKTSTNNLMLVTFLLSKGFKLIECKISWIPCVLFTLEGKQVKATLKKFNHLELEDFDNLSPHIVEVLEINEAQLKKAHIQQRREFEERMLDA